MISEGETGSLTASEAECGTATGVLESACISQRFKVKAKGISNQYSLNVTPAIIDFNRLLRRPEKRIFTKASTSEPSPVISGISNRDLLHAVVGLYDTCLSDLTPDVLYSTVCANWARTIILVRDVKDAFLEFEKKRDKRSSKPDPEAECTELSELKSSEADKYVPSEPLSSTFSCCYSDSDVEEEDESDDDEDEDYSQGINRYLRQAIQRRKARAEHTGPFKLEHIGPENRIVAACTFDKKYVRSGEKIAHMTLISIRQRFRRLGLGKYLIDQVKDPAVAGPHDAIVVHAESEAVPFFQKFGFSDDIVLNNKWREIAEQFTNCVLLTYIPPYTGQAVSGSVTDIDLLALDHDLRKWKEKSIEGYQAQVTIIERMKAEMTRLRAMISTQDAIIKEYQSKLMALEREKVNAADKLMLHKFNELSFSTTDDESSLGAAVSLGNAGDKARQLSDTNCVLTHPLSTDRDLGRYVVVRKDCEEVYDHGKDIAEFHRIYEDFKNSLRTDPELYQYITVCKAALNQAVVDRYARMLSDHGSSTLVMKLYFCGTLERSDRMKDILKSGFSEQDFVNGDYGRGLYFTRCASSAINFSTPNKALVAEVIIGRCQSVVSKDKSRLSPDNGYDSIMCPGRSVSVGEEGEDSAHEYVVFNCNQVLPVDLVKFTVASSAALHPLAGTLENSGD